MKTEVDLPYKKAPCKNCPFRKDCLKGWLGKKRMTEILNQGSFVCHKNNSLQCAGHMIIKKDKNEFVWLADKMNYKINLKKENLIFESSKEAINHHSEKL